MYTVYDEPLHVQAMKVKVADLLREFQEIRERRIYHKIAYRYEIDSIIDKVANYFDEAAKIGDEAMTFIQQRGLANMADFPPIIKNRIAEIVAAFAEDNPSMTAADRTALIGALFMDGGEFDGLINEDQTINQEWLDKYLADPNNLPEYYNDVPLTEEMMRDMDAVYSRTDISQEEKENLFSSYFHPGGKYDGYIQQDGTVNKDKIIKQSK
jgi:hypothetical protein